jgi:uroporphyrinogen-III synthase
MRLLVTRPEPDATRTAEALIRLGHVPVLSPMLDIVLYPQAKLPEGPLQAVLVTSTNAVRALAAHPDRERLAALPLLAVGDRTALAARRAGFPLARSAGGALDDLVALAAGLDPGAPPLLYLAGEVRAGDLSSRLAALGFSVETAIVYRAEPRLRLSGVGTAALKEGSVAGVLLYSRRSAAAFALALRAASLAPLGEAVACFCLSAAVAEPIAPIARGPVLVAEAPDQLSLFALIDAAGRRPAGARDDGRLA